MASQPEIYEKAPREKTEKYGKQDLFCLFPETDGTQEHNSKFYKRLA